MSLVSGGYRNQFDAAFNPHGEIFTFDSDMEWDIALPWYRPVRILHAPMGSDFGWRTGAANQMDYLFDTLPALHDTGRGSPVGVECYDSFAWPERYRGAILCADWSIGILYAVLPEISGGTYKAKIEKLIEGRPMNITDVAIGPDGAAYLSLGGRGGAGEVYRLRDNGAKREIYDFPTSPNRKLLNASDQSLSAYADGTRAVLYMGQPLAGYRRAQLAKAFADGGPTLLSQLHDVSRNKSVDALIRVKALDLLQRFTTDGVSTGRLAELLKDDDVAFVRAHAVSMLGRQSRGRRLRAASHGAQGWPPVRAANRVRGDDPGRHRAVARRVAAAARQSRPLPPLRGPLGARTDRFEEVGRPAPRSGKARLPSGTRHDRRPVPDQPGGRACRGDLRLPQAPRSTERRLRHARRGPHDAARAVPHEGAARQRQGDRQGVDAALSASRLEGLPRARRRSRRPPEGADHRRFPGSTPRRDATR